TLFCPPAALPENAAGLDAIMLRSLPAPSELSDVVDDRVRTLCLGPGLGLEPAIKSLVEAALQLDRITVLDADALTVFTGTPEQLFEQTNPRCVLTPHEGEFARLFPDLSEALRNGAPRLESVQQAADRAGAVVLLKGAVTVVGAPGRAVHVHAALGSTAVPWLATAGAGDVLAGMIAGLAAASPACDLLRMTCFAVWLHAAVARHVGPGLIAEDLPDALPAVLRGLAK
ncbi:MAG: NAD(P)H-hydrate dehydratase, partial [Pseudomonadota bacterium]